MKMYECIRTKVYLTYTSNKSRKSSTLSIRFIENADFAAFSKDFLLLNNRKQTMRTKRMFLRIWYEVSPYRSKSTGQVSLEMYLPDIKVKRYRTYRDDRLVLCFKKKLLDCIRGKMSAKELDHTKQYSVPLDLEGINMVDMEIIRSVQRRHFGHDLISLGKGKCLKSCSSIVKLDPFIDDE